MPFVAATRAIGRAGLFTLSVLAASKPTADFFRELVREIYKIGARTLPIVTVGGAFVGLSVTLLGYRALDTYGAANQVKDIRSGDQVHADPDTWTPPAEDLRPRVVPPAGAPAEPAPERTSTATKEKHP